MPTIALAPCPAASQPPPAASGHSGIWDLVSASHPMRSASHRPIGRVAEAALLMTLGSESNESNPNETIMK